MWTPYFCAPQEWNSEFRIVLLPSLCVRAKLFSPKAALGSNSSTVVTLCFSVCLAQSFHPALLVNFLLLTEHCDQGHQKVSAHDGQDSIVPGGQNRKLRFSVITTNRSTENRMRARQSLPWSLPKQRHPLGSKCSNAWAYVGHFSTPHKSPA